MPDSPPTVGFSRYQPGDADALVGFLSGSRWPYHGTPQPTPDVVRGWIADGDYQGDVQELHWVLDPGGDRVGTVHLQDLDDPTALTDFRVREDARGRGYGRAMVRFAADRAFSAHRSLVRVEAQTRADNAAMRRVLEASRGWVLEACYRRSWPDPDGAYHDSLGYAILRDDWATGTVTPVAWPAR